MKPDFPNVHMYKVNTLNAYDIRDKYADGNSKPYFKFYKNSDFQDEVKYISNWNDQEVEVRKYMHRHNGGKGMFYTSRGKVYELKNLNEFNDAMSGA